MSFNVGENVGPYRIVEQLGQGGMATVYKAFHAALDRYVALKALHPAFGQDPNFTARFQREARLVAKLEHPHIVPIYDYAEHEGRPYLVMKFIEGETLKARLHKGPLTSVEIANVVDSVGSALSFAHGQGILHRDVKPSNVLIGSDGTMWLADFGLARIAESPDSTLSSDMIMGTPQYISPEQAMGDRKLDEGTDIYSFGVMLYELVVGQVPFNADTPFSVIHDHIYSALPMPRAVNPNVPETVERVLLKALAKDRADRYADVGSLVKAFKDAWIEAGVPMEGTAIKVRASASTLPPTAPAPPAATTAVAAKPADVTVPTAAGKPKAMPAWPFLISGALLLVCVAIGALFALRSLTGRRAGFALLPTAPPPTAAATLAVQAGLNPTLTVAAPTAVLIPALATAQAGVEENAADPQAALALALAYWDAGQPRPALVTLASAADLAGRENTGFFQDAGDQFRQRGAWIAATAMYVRAIKSLGPGAIPPDDLRTKFHEALYQASTQPDLLTYLSFEDLAVVEQPIAMVASARRVYYNGNTTGAHMTLNQVFTLRPHMPEASLLQAEMDAKEGKTFEAKQILNILMADLATPDWVREYAQSLSNKIP